MSEAVAMGGIDAGHTVAAGTRATRPQMRQKKSKLETQKLLPDRLDRMG